jgi:hypothetical protein
MAATKRWGASYYDAAGKRHRKTFATKTEAELWEAKGKAEAAEIKATKANKTLSRVVQIHAATGNE